LQQTARPSAYAGLGMTSAELAARYREYAAKCLVIAKDEQDLAERLVLLDMAQAWLALAEHAAKNAALVVCETPPKPIENS
jgi:hypothetical protein